MMQLQNPKNILLFMAFFIAFNYGYGQESVFNGMKNDKKKADEYFESGNFPKALELYLIVENKKNRDDAVVLNIARTCFKLQEYEQANIWYKMYLESHSFIPAEDFYVYAEVLAGVGDYNEAIQYYYLYKEDNHEEDQTVIQKIWSLRNIKHLFEDSIYYSVKPININTKDVEFGPQYYQDGLVFVGNRKEVGGIKNIDATNIQTFQTVYFTKIESDSLEDQVVISFEKPRKFAPELETKFHRGTVSFFPDQQRMVYSQNGELDPISKTRYLQLIFAQKTTAGRWEEMEPFKYNSTQYSVSHPALSDDGNILYFVSDMPGGFGGKDIYKSNFTDDGWSEPENLGNIINTSGDESFPYHHNGTTLYFASNGHTGLGGLDIFKMGNGTSRIINMGYPVNTQFDDFGIVLNEGGTSGYISSNRLGRGMDDDIFEMKIDIQSYPLIIAGIVKFHTSINKEKIDLQVLDSARLILIDSKNNAVINETVTNESGGFQIEIPYSGNFLIKVVEERIGEKIVSLQIPKRKKLSTVHEIIIVPEQFNYQNDTQSPVRLQKDSDNMRINRPIDNKGK